MAAVAIEELGERIRDYVRRAAEGETVLIEEGGKVVARLVPVPTVKPPEWLFEEPALLRLWLDGHLTLPTSTDKSPPEPLPGAKIPLEQLLRDLDEDRADRW
jgi:antitoxin (DNA-binding transcriptional repressor) of toxin-antitoxin stability system